jgi:hypothetical protein
MVDFGRILFHAFPCAATDISEPPFRDVSMPMRDADNTGHSC